MRAILFLVLFMFILCQPKSYLHATKEERIERQKIMKERLLKCIYENAREEFKKFVKENEETFRYSYSKNKDNISIEDKRVVRECRRKIIEERNEERKKELKINNDK